MKYSASAEVTRRNTQTGPGDNKLVLFWVLMRKVL